MNKLLLVLVTIILLGSMSAIARDYKVKDCTVASLIMGINSDNFGLRTSSAYMLGELQCEKGVIPLMRMLKSEEREDARIVAALALLKIGSEKGIFAIKQAIRFDDSERVRRQCANFYHVFSDKTLIPELFAVLR
jgi:HEAT repeat protein